jgi:fructoselysine-6-P-deglycase FrlB-like protein
VVSSGWIRRFREDIYSQAERLQGLKLPNPQKIKDPIFIGSGDSYACALLVEYLSRHSSLAYYPSDILLDPKMLFNHDIFFISASGRTRSSIKAAEVARKFEVQTTAITPSSDSELARTCKHVLNLSYPRPLVSSAVGTLDFTATLLACLSLIGIRANLNSIGSIMDEASTLSHLISVHVKKKNSRSFVFLGNGMLYPIAIYGALKVYEVLGVKSHGYVLDDYIHSPLFGLRKSDCVVVLDQESLRDPMPAVLQHRLHELRFNSHYVQPGVNRSNIENLLFSIFFIQVFVLNIAEKLGIDRCYFLSNKRMLKLSSSLIY